MRLSQTTREMIKTTIAQELGADAVVRLFGSRVVGTKRGGNIDLLVETKLPLPSRIRTERQLAAKLFIKLGDRKADVLIKVPDMPLQLVHQQALNNGGGSPGEISDEL